MQQPTHRHIRIRNARDADILFHAVLSGMLPMITRRLDSEERMALAPGDVYVWQERTGSISESTDHAIERFTEGRSWAASRAKDASPLSTDQGALANPVALTCLFFPFRTSCIIMRRTTPQNRLWSNEPKRSGSVFVHYTSSHLLMQMFSKRYQEDPMSVPPIIPRRPGERMIKQTYSVYVNSPVPAFHCRGKLHLS